MLNDPSSVHKQPSVTGELLRRGENQSQIRGVKALVVQCLPELKPNMSTGATSVARLKLGEAEEEGMGME